MPAKTKRDDMPRQPGYVYLLHFTEAIGSADNPRGRAQHYVGCTTDLRTRLTGHAHGRTARIVAAVIERGLEWQLAAVGVTHRRGMRKIERQVKNWHSARKFCPLCGNEGRLPGTTPYPVELLPFAANSVDLRKASERPAPVVRSARAGENLDPVVARIMDEEKESVGFLPTGPGGAITQAQAAGRLLVAQAGDDVVGYVVWTETADEVKIQQTAVRSGWQSQGIGGALVRTVLKMRAGVTVTCRVRADLRACAEFWPRLGFFIEYREPHPSSGSEMVGFFNPNGEPHFIAPSKPAKPEEDEPW